MDNKKNRITYNMTTRRVMKQCNKAMKRRKSMRNMIALGHLLHPPIRFPGMFPAFPASSSCQLTPPASLLPPNSSHPPAFKTSVETCT